MPAYAALRFHVTGLWRIVNPRLQLQLIQSQTEMQQLQRHSGTPVLRAYHGTAHARIPRIVQENFSMSARGQTDQGWFGSGLCFSQHADYVMFYYTVGQERVRPVTAGERGRLLQVDILPGRTHRMEKAEVGAACHPGYDSHVSPNAFVHVVFDPRHVLPRYIIDFEVRAAPGAALDGLYEHLGPAAGSQDSEQELDGQKEDEDVDKITAPAQPASKKM